MIDDIHVPVLDELWFNAFALLPSSSSLEQLSAQQVVGLFDA
jgi:hypothetical protein